MRRGGWTAAGLLLLLGACATSSPEDQAPPSRAPLPSPPPTVAPTAPAQAAVKVPPKDACGASELQGLVGRPRTEIPVPIDPNRQRVACTTCPVTQDYRPERLNFFFDAESGIIKEIRCG